MWLASYSIGDMLQWIVQIDPHPPLYYLLLHFWVDRFEAPLLGFRYAVGGIAENVREIRARGGEVSAGGGNGRSFSTTHRFLVYFC